MDSDRHQTWLWSRRTLLQTTVAGLAMMGSRALSVPDAFAGGLPEGRLMFFNVWTDERLHVTYRNEAGHYDLAALDDVNQILRCHYTGEVASMDVRVLEHVNLVQKKLGGTGRSISFPVTGLLNTMPCSSGPGDGPPSAVCTCKGRRSIYGFPASILRWCVVPPSN